jgi:TolB-like protein/DNA-binding winged helix-turn-helix (wHTH) protein
LLQLLLEGSWRIISAAPGWRGAFTSQAFHFGEFTLDRTRYRLQRGTGRLRLEKLPMELLILLLQRHGELVSREEIAECLWGKGVFLDIDHSINTAVRKIRVVLKDDPERPRFVETIIGKGYRFAAPISCSNGDSASQVQPAQVHSLPSPAQAAQGGLLFREKKAVGIRLWLWLAAASLAAIFVAAFALNHWWNSIATQPLPIRSLAVLPLENLSGDPAQEYFADGMTEALIGSLSRIHDLRVISRTSVMRLKGTSQTIPEIARALNVDAILEGAVIREGSQIRIHAQLIRGVTDEHIWTGEYQREYRSVLALQDEVARTIAQRIEINLTPQDQVGLAHLRSVDPQAHEDYLKGRYYVNQRTTDTLNKSIGYFRQAIARDPSYALPYCGLADAYALLGFRGGVPSREALSQAKAAALKAIELDDTLAEPHVSLAFIAETH